jgi:hypothetical protein
MELLQGQAWHVIRPLDADYKCKAPTPSILWGMKRNEQGHTSITAFSIGAARHVFAEVFFPDRQEDAGLLVPKAYAI